MGQCQCKREGSDGVKWTGMLFVFSNPKEPDSSSVSESNFMDKLMGKISLDVKIECVYKYSTKLGSSCRCHSFLVFKTEKRYYSIEKDKKGIVLQLGIEEDDVLQNYRGNKREDNPVLKEEFVLKKTVDIESFMRHFFDNKELQNTYAPCPREKNCQGFANKYFKWLTT